MIYFAKSRLFVLIQITAMFLASVATAEPQVMKVQQALSAIESGDMILLDIRTEPEWKETGVAKGAWPVNLQDKQFSKTLMTIINRNPDKKIGLICATGGRSGYVFGALKKYGVQNIVNVSEGMLGSADGPGWLQSGLPVVSGNDAKAALPADLTAK